MVWQTEDNSCAGISWDETIQDCNGIDGGALLLINATDFLLINASGDRLIIDSTMWNQVQTETC